MVKKRQPPSLSDQGREAGRVATEPVRFAACTHAAANRERATPITERSGARAQRVVRSEAEHGQGAERPSSSRYVRESNPEVVVASV